MRYLSIKNYDRYQHYKDRRPPWIKLHSHVLDDYAFSCLQDASKAHLMLLWVLASKLDNRIPYDPEWIARQLSATSPVDVEVLVLHGFIEVTQDDSTALAPRKQSAMLETETETEAETDSSATRKSGKGEPKPAKPAPPERPPSWVAEGVGWWAENVGVTSYPRFGKALTAAVGAHGWPDVFRAAKCYVTECKARDKPPKPEWLASEIVLWIEKAKAPPLEGDVLTPHAKRALGIPA